jgi:hypothetical protein
MVELDPLHINLTKLTKDIAFHLILPKEKGEKMNCTASHSSVVE